MERAQILEAVSKLTVLELSQLIKDMEEKFGVSAAAAVAAAAPAAGGGAMPNLLMSVLDVKALAALPSREELLAMLIGTLQAPVAKLVRTMNEVPGRFVRTLAAVRDAQARKAA